MDLAEAFGAHAPRVFTYFRRMGLPRDGAADLAQETFLRAIRAAPRYRGEAPVETWILGIARNVFREWLRARRDHGEPFPPDADGSESRAAGPPPDEPSTERLDVERALARLDSEHREVLVLRFVLDLSGEEVAALLGISHDAVRQRVARAKGEFRRLWGA